MAPAAAPKTPKVIEVNPEQRAAQTAFIHKLIGENGVDEAEYSLIAEGLLRLMNPRAILADIESFKNPDKNHKQNIIILLKHLIKSDYSSEFFTKRQIEDFFRKIKDKGFTDEDINSLNLLGRRTNQAQRSEKSRVSNSGPEDLSMFIASLNTSDKNSDENAKKLASDLTLISKQHLLKIKSFSLHRNGMAEDNLKVLAQESDRISAMVRLDILNAKTPEHRKKIMKFYFKTYDECMKQRNYHSAFAIQQAFSSAQINRLLDKSSEEKLMQMSDDLFLSNFKNYRAKQEQHLKDEVDFIPLLPAMGNALEFINQNPDYLEKDKLVNHDKLVLLGKQFAMITSIQQNVIDAQQFLSKSHTNIASRLSSSEVKKHASNTENLAAEEMGLSLQVLMQSNVEVETNKISNLKQLNNLFRGIKLDERNKRISLRVKRGDADKRYDHALPKPAAIEKVASMYDQLAKKANTTDLKRAIEIMIMIKAEAANLDENAEKKCAETLVNLRGRLEQLNKKTDTKDEISNFLLTYSSRKLRSISKKIEILQPKREAGTKNKNKL